LDPGRPTATGNDASSIYYWRDSNPCSDRDGPPGALANPNAIVPIMAFLFMWTEKFRMITAPPSQLQYTKHSRRQPGQLYLQPLPPGQPAVHVTTRQIDWRGECLDDCIWIPLSVSHLQFFSILSHSAVAQVSDPQLSRGSLW
jgi:hypothetical protein